MGIELSSDSKQVLVAFLVYLLGVAGLGIFSHRYLTRGSFIKGYFLGNRGLGPWVLALTVAATAISGGSFMGFPSLIYTNGWIMALWICSYMVVPLTTMTLLGKRINQVARITGAVTVPDVLRDRFNSPALGIVSTLVILLSLTFNLVAQFKGGGLVMKEALRLPPARGTLADAQVDRERFLVLKFQLEDGSTASQRTPLPHVEARYLPEKTTVGTEEVLVHFAVGNETLSKRVKLPPQRVRIAGSDVDKGYLLGLLIFALTVVAYTTYGGFWAVTWTDVLEGIVMLVGVLTMAFLAMRAVPPVTVQHSSPGGTAPVVVTEELTGLAAATERLRQQDSSLILGPGPGAFLPLGMAFSFFLMWSLSSAGQPSGMVRLMSFKDVPSLRRALLLVGLYYFLTYLSLLVIFVCARAIFPTEYLREIGSEGEPDSIMPAMARHLAPPLVAGLLLAAPYAAIMSTVAAFLLMISSSLVRDLYQRSINPDVSPRVIKGASYAVTALVGVVVMVGALNPPGFLQYIIVFTGSGMSCAFLFPMVLSLYWRRATAPGVLSGMLGGFLVILGLYALGWTDSCSQRTLQEHAERVASGDRESAAAAEPPAMATWLQQNLGWIPGWGEKRPDAFAPIYMGGLDPLVWGFLVSLVLTVGLSACTRPDPVLVARYFP